MVIGVLEVTFHIPHAESLKDRRKVVLHLKDRIRRRFNVSLAETEGQETWNECTLAFAMVAMSQAAIERDLNRIVDWIGSDPRIDHTDHAITFV